MLSTRAAVAFNIEEKRRINTYIIFKELIHMLESTIFIALIVNLVFNAFSAKLFFLFPTLLDFKLYLFCT